MILANSKTDTMGYNTLLRNFFVANVYRLVDPHSIALACIASDRNEWIEEASVETKCKCTIFSRRALQRSKPLKHPTMSRLHAVLIRLNRQHLLLIKYVIWCEIYTSLRIPLTSSDNLIWWHLSVFINNTITSGYERSKLFANIRGFGVTRR